jgi:hypothetical protein
MRMVSSSRIPPPNSTFQPDGENRFEGFQVGGGLLAERAAQVDDVDPSCAFGLELLGLCARVVAILSLAGRVALGQADDFAVAQVYGGKNSKFWHKNLSGHGLHGTYGLPFGHTDFLKFFRVNQRNPRNPCPIFHLVKVPFVLGTVCRLLSTVVAASRARARALKRASAL